jgi:hypothetical protein
MPVLRRAPVAAALLLGLLCAATAAAAPNYTLVWSSGFEDGFPGDEWHPYNNGSWSPGGTMPAGRVSAWTITNGVNGDPIYKGSHAFRGWITAPASDNHRAYPGIHADDPQNIPDPIQSPFVNTYWVWLDANYAGMGSTEWISLGTWANNTSWIVHTLSVRDRKLRLAHTDPFEGEYIGPLPRPDFPLRRWVRLTVYVEYDGPNGFTQVWQDGVPMLRANYAAPTSGTSLLRAHWGLYAHPNVDYAVLYNDDNKIYELSAPITNFVAEPVPEPPRACGEGAGMAMLGGAFYLRRFGRRHDDRS